MNQFTNRRLLSIGTVLFLLILFMSSCEQDITVDLPEGEQKIVVEGHVEPGKPVYVFLSKTAPYFASVDSDALLEYVIRNAKVTVSNGATTDTLMQLVSEGYFYISPNMIGEVGKHYSLKVVTEDGKTVTAETEIHPAIPLDSIWFKVQPNKDSLGYVWGHLTDPDTLGNCYRWFAKRLHKDSDFVAPQNSTFNDRFINGKSFDFAYDRGSVPNSNAEDDENDERGFFKAGDTIIVKFCTITQESYQFWNSAENQIMNNSNPFGSTAPVLSYVNGGIGVWEGMASFVDTVIATK